MSDLPASPDPALLDDVAALRALVLAERAALAAVQAELKAGAVLIEKLRLTIAKLKHQRFGASAERSQRLVDQLELELVELGEDRAAAEARVEILEQALPQSVAVKSVERRPLPDHLPRERVVHPGPNACACCGGANLRKLGEDVSETLECVPARWKVIEHVREKFTCRDCEAISQAPAPSHPIARGRAGPQLLAQVLFGKYGAHLPLNRQSAIYAREGVELDVSTLAD
jgi:transposase